MVTTLGEYVFNEPTNPWVDQTAGNIDTKGVPRKGPSYIRNFADGKEGRGSADSGNGTSVARGDAEPASVLQREAG